MTATSVWTRTTAAYTALVFVANLLALPIYASEPVAVAGQAGTSPADVENTQIAVRGGVVTITYDLITSDANGTFKVRLDVSTNGGQTYDVQPRSTSGDVGPVVAAGRGKRIVWEAGKDVESLQTSQFRFRVVIEVDTRPGVETASPSSQTTPGIAPSLPKSAGGNRLMWPGLMIFGAGGALAATAAAGPLRKRQVYPDFYELTPNTPVIFGAIGVAGAGVLLMLLGRRGAPNTALIVPIPGGVMLYRTATF